MKGIIFRLLEQVVTRAHGDETWEKLLEATGLSGEFTTLGNYPDEQLRALVDAAAEATGEPTEVVIRWFGREAMPVLANLYPEFFQPHHSLATFLPTLNDVIHAEVRKLYPDAVVPEFDFTRPDPHSIRLVYRSPRKLCALAEGFIEGAATLLGETVTITQPECMLLGGERCVLDCTFEPAQAA